MIIDSKLIKGGINIVETNNDIHICCLIIYSMYIINA